MKTPPNRAIILTLKIEADTPEDMIDTLHQIGMDIALGNLTKGVNGGVAAGYAYDYQANPGPSHNEYMKQLSDFIAENKKGL